MEANVGGLYSLPVEAIDKILSYLSYEELVAMGQTCSYLDKILNCVDSKYHWRHVSRIEFDLSCRTYQHKLSILEVCRRIPVVKISNVKMDHSHHILTIAQNSRGLANLNMAGCEIHFDDLLQMSLFSPKLESLILHNVHVDTSVRNKIGGFTQLRHLTCENTRINAADLNRLAGQSHGLAFLRVDLLDLGYINGREAMEAFSNWSNLLVLHIKCYGDIWHLTFLNNLPNLEELIIEQGTVVDAMKILEISEKCERLTKLTFTNCRVTEEVKTLIEELTCAFSIEFINDIRMLHYWKTTSTRKNPTQTTEKSPAQ